MELQLLKFSKLFMFVEMRLFLLNYFFKKNKMDKNKLYLKNWGYTHKKRKRKYASWIAGLINSEKKKKRLKRRGAHNDRPISNKSKWGDGRGPFSKTKRQRSSLQQVSQPVWSSVNITKSPKISNSFAISIWHNLLDNLLRWEVKISE